MIAGLTAAEAEAEGLRVENLAPTRLIPHPFNEPSRSQVTQGEATWDELLTSVQAHGVRIAVAAVTRTAFTRRWPDLLGAGDDGEYVLVYGHRRRAAALATNQPTIPVIVDDTLLDAPAGGLIEMYQENRGRHDLSPLAEADLLGRIATELNVGGQKELGEYLGLSQPTVSRRMSLLLLCPGLRLEVAEGRLSPTEGAQLGAKLPYGPVRPWQKDTANSSSPSAAEQSSKQRQADQMRVLELFKANKTLIHQAVERVKAERQSRAAAGERGIELVDPTVYFGDETTARAHRIYDDAIDNPAEVVAATDEFGALALYERLDPATQGAEHEVDSHDGTAGPTRTRPEKPAPDDPPASHKAPGEKAPRNAEKQRTEAREARQAAAASIIDHRPSQTRLLHVLADQYASGIASLTGPKAVHLAETWGYDQEAESDPEESRLSRAWAIALATYELLATSDATWGLGHRAYIDLLRERAKYEPTAWERAQLDSATDSS